MGKCKEFHRPIQIALRLYILLCLTFMLLIPNIYSAGKVWVQDGPKGSILPRNHSSELNDPE